MMNRRTFSAGLCGCMTGFLGGCMTHSSGPSTGLADLPGNYKPALDSDEAGLWLQVQKAEQAIKTSASRIREPGINQLITDMVARMVPDRKNDLRIYVMRIPAFNATCAPNGYIDVWTGLLLRARTESELAAVLGHEISHYVRQHSLASQRDMRTKADALAVFNTMIGMAGAPPGTADLTNMLALMSVLHFSREHEREADDRGFQLMAEAGYDPFAAAEIWKRLMDVSRASGQAERDTSIFLSTHPAPQDREQYLRELAEKFKRPGPPPPDRLRQALVPIRTTLLADEVSQGTFKQTSRLLDLLMPDDPAPGQLLYARGNLHRKRGEDQDEALSLGYYHQACEAAGAPPEAFRMVGIIRWRRGEREQAREYFRRYLAVKPDAGDRKMIESYLGAA